jgi:hypothetical protein
VPERPTLPVEVCVDKAAEPGDLIGALADLLIERAKKALCEREQAGVNRPVQLKPPCQESCYARNNETQSVSQQ